MPQPLRRILPVSAWKRSATSTGKAAPPQDAAQERGQIALADVRVVARARCYMVGTPFMMGGALLLDIVAAIASASKRGAAAPRCRSTDAAASRSQREDVEQRQRADRARLARLQLALRIEPEIVDRAGRGEVGMRQHRAFRACRWCRRYIAAARCRPVRDRGPGRGTLGAASAARSASAPSPSGTGSAGSADGPHAPSSATISVSIMACSLQLQRHRQAAAGCSDRERRCARRNRSSLWASSRSASSGLRCTTRAPARRRAEKARRGNAASSADRGRPPVASLPMPRLEEAGGGADRHSSASRA